MKNPKIKLFKKQIECFKALEDRTTNEVLFGGGAGGSKTFTGCLWQITRRLKYPGTRSVIGRSKLKNLKATTLNTFMEVAVDYCGLTPNVDFTYNASESTITFYNKSVIYLKDLFLYPSDSMFTSLGGLEITDCFIDEAAEVTEKAINVLNSRIRYKLDEFNLIPKTLLTCNPSKGWLYSKYYKPSLTQDLESHRKFIKSLVTDNKAISKHYITQLEKLDKISKERLLFGNWEYIDDDALLFDYNSLQDTFNNTFIEQGAKYITCDVARLGADKSVIILWSGLRAEKIISIAKNTIPEIVIKINDLKNSNQIPNSKVVIDQDGVGGGVADAFSGCVAFTNGGKALKGENYQNLKTQCFYKLAELINTGKIFIKDKTFKDVIISELEVIKRDKVDKDQQKLAIEGKDIQKQKLGRSPDFADALMMRMWFECFGSYGEYAII
jgi:phage terminase large subunit